MTPESSVSLDELRDVTSEMHAPDAVAALVRDPSLADQLVDRLLAAPGAVPPGTSDYELWPVLNARMSTFATGGGSSWFTATAAQLAST